jgi:hypothetical protein
LFGHRAEDQRGDAAPAVAADHDQVAAEFPGLVGDGFGNAALAGFEQQGSTLTPSICLTASSSNSPASTMALSALSRLSVVEKVRLCMPIRVSSATWATQLAPLQQAMSWSGRTRGFAVVDGDQNVFVWCLFL